MNHHICPHPVSTDFSKHQGRLEELYQEYRDEYGHAPTPDFLRRFAATKGVTVTFAKVKSFISSLEKVHALPSSVLLPGSNDSNSNQTTKGVRTGSTKETGTGVQHHAAQGSRQLSCVYFISYLFGNTQVLTTV